MSSSNSDAQVNDHADKTPAWITFLMVIFFLLALLIGVASWVDSLRGLGIKNEPSWVYLVFLFVYAKPAILTLQAFFKTNESFERRFVAGTIWFLVCALITNVFPFLVILITDNNVIEEFTLEIYEPILWLISISILAAMCSLLFCALSNFLHFLHSKLFGKKHSRDSN